MAYPIKLFDFQTDEGKKAGFVFLKNLDQDVTKLFGVLTRNDNQRQIHRWKEGEVPPYLTELATKSVRDILKKLPEGTMKWKGSVGVYGRKTGSTIKRENNLMYRILINVGDIEIYHLDGEGLSGEPAVLPNGYALLCSPVMIDKVDIKVNKDPIRKGLNQKLIGLVPKIRGKDYLRMTIVLDLLEDGLTVTPTDQTVTPTDQTVTPTDQTVTPTDQTVTPTDQTVTPTDQTVTPTDQTVTPTDQTVTPTDQTVTPTDQTVTPTDQTVTPTDQTVTPTC